MAAIALWVCGGRLTLDEERSATLVQNQATFFDWMNGITAGGGVEATGVFFLSGGAGAGATRWGSCGQAKAAQTRSATS